MNICPSDAPAQPLCVITLGNFSSCSAPLASRLAAINVEAIHSITLAQLPAALNPHDVLLTDLAWLNALTAAECDDWS